MPKYRIFSNGIDNTYNNYYNSRVNAKRAQCPVSVNRPPINIIQGGTSYIYNEHYDDSTCHATGSMYPYGLYLPNKSRLPSVDPPIDLAPQAVLVYGIEPSNVVPCDHGFSSDEEEGCIYAEPFIGLYGETRENAFRHPIADAAHHTHNDIGHNHHNAERSRDHNDIGHNHDDIGHNHHCEKKEEIDPIWFQTRMELLKTYRFRCYECINPLCPANVIALKMLRDERDNKSGTTTTTMTFGPTGTTTTTTTTIKIA